MTTSVGWCAGKPADHGLADEAAVARLFAETYPHTSAVRDFRTGAPSLTWWGTQTCGAIGELYDAGVVDPASVDVVLSWTQPQDTAGLAGLIGSTPGWVRRTYLLGRHEPEKKVSATQFHDEMLGIRQELDAGGYDRQAVQLGPAMTLYRSRIGAPQDFEAYVGALAEAGAIDFIAHDAYPSNPADRPNAAGLPREYEAPYDFTAFMRHAAARYSLPYAIAELHHGRVDSDPDGWGCADWHEGVYREAAADGALFVTHFSYSGGDFLAHDRWPELTRWRSVVREADTARRQFAAGQHVGRASAIADVRAWLESQS